ncbi:hypothetical protein [Streptomyces sp. NPDC001275]
MRRRRAPFRRREVLVRPGERGQLRFGIHGTAALFHDLGPHECLFLTVPAVVGEVVVDIGKGVVSPPRIDQDAAEQMDDPI